MSPFLLYSIIPDSRIVVDTSRDRRLKLANTTFSNGPVRSENGFKNVIKMLQLVRSQMR